MSGLIAHCTLSAERGPPGNSATDRCGTPCAAVVPPLKHRPRLRSNAVIRWAVAGPRCVCRALVPRRPTSRRGRSLRCEWVRSPRSLPETGSVKNYQFKGKLGRRAAGARSGATPAQLESTRAVIRGAVASPSVARAARCRIARHASRPRRRFDCGFALPFGCRSASISASLRFFAASGPGRSGVIGRGQA